MMSAILPVPMSRSMVRFRCALCETTIAVRFMNGRGTSRLAFLADRPGFVWGSPVSKGPIDARLREAEGPTG